MEEDLARIFRYSTDFYLEKQKMIMLFSIPFLFAFLIPTLVAAPTYIALGGVFLRTGSIPDLSLSDIIITLIGYAIAVFLISDTIVNLNLIIKSRRTMTEIKSVIIQAMGTYALRVFAIYTVLLVVMFLVQTATYESPLQSIIYPLFSLLISFLLFFVAPAIVIDESDLMTAISRSTILASKKPMFIFVWILTAFISLSLTKIIADLVFSGALSGYFVLFINSLIVLPYLTILQTQMYMEKYPLAR